MYLQSYHQAVTHRLQELSEQQLETCDVYFLLDFLHNIYTRYTHHEDWCRTRTGGKDEDKGRSRTDTRNWAAARLIKGLGLKLEPRLLVGFETGFREKLGQRLGLRP